MFLKGSEVGNVEGDNIGGCTLCTYTWLAIENRLLLFKVLHLLKKVIAMKRIKKVNLIFLFVADITNVGLKVYAMGSCKFASFYLFEKFLHLA